MTSFLKFSTNPQVSSEVLSQDVSNPMRPVPRKFSTKAEHVKNTFIHSAATPLVSQPLEGSNLDGLDFERD